MLRRKPERKDSYMSSVRNEGMKISARIDHGDGRER